MIDQSHAFPLASIEGVVATSAPGDRPLVFLTLVENVTTMLLTLTPFQAIEIAAALNRAVGQVQAHGLRECGL